MSSALTIVLKYVGSILTVVLGVLAVIAKVRDDGTHRITRQGWTLLICIISAGAVAITFQVFEDFQKETERDDATRKTNELLEQVIRSQYPLRDVQLSCAVEVDAKALAPFDGRFLQTVTAARAAITAGAKFSTDISGYGLSNGVVDRVLACRDSALYPRADSETQAYALVEQMKFVLRLYRTPISSAAYPYRRYGHARFSASTPPPDIEMLFPPNYSASSNSCVAYDFTARTFRLEASDLNSNSRYWRSSGRIISVPDLRGAQLFIGVWSTSSSLTDETKQLSAGLHTVQLKIGDLDTFWLPTNRMTKHLDDDEAVFWEYCFPATIDAILALTINGQLGPGV
jgi:hypothetical protein